MELLASGRDADVYALDDDRVLHRRRSGGAPTWEPALHAYLRRHGYPVPALLDVEGGDTVYERIHGPLLLEDALRRPWRVRQHARLLAWLHSRLHSLPAPAFLPRVGDGSALLHLDLHPGNVILGRDGPVVIDWTNAGVGHAGQDLAVLWVLLRVADVPLAWPARAALAATRGVFLHAFLQAAGRDEAAAHLADAIERRLADPNTLPTERERLENLRVRAWIR